MVPEFHSERFYARVTHDWKMVKKEHRENVKYGSNLHPKDYIL